MALDKAEQVRAIGLPIRREMLELLGQVGPSSVAELAVKMEVAPTRLHYHANMLAANGLIRAVGTRRVRARTETIYDRAADEFVVSPLGKPPEYVQALKQAAAAMLGMAAKDHDSALDSGFIDQSNTSIWRGTATLSPDRLAEVRELLGRLRTLFGEEKDSTDGEEVSLTLFMTPAAGAVGRRRKG